MKKSLYILGSVEIILGILLLCINSIIKTVLPVLGRVAYQAAAAGSYSPVDYEISLPFVITAAVVLIIVGVAQIVLCVFGKYSKEK